VKLKPAKLSYNASLELLSKWWEVISSPLMITKMESETLKDEQGDIVYHSDGTPMNNMIGH
jgi:hypothetical protein